MPEFKIKYEDGILNYQTINVKADNYGKAERLFERTVGYKNILSIKLVLES